MNQGFYKRLWIAQDGTVERYELTEPFAALLGRDRLTAGPARVRGSNAEPAGFEAGEAWAGKVKPRPLWEVGVLPRSFWWS